MTAASRVVLKAAPAAMDDETQHLGVPKALLRRHGGVVVRADLVDAHVYVLSPRALALLEVRARVWLCLCLRDGGAVESRDGGAVEPRDARCVIAPLSLVTLTSYHRSESPSSPPPAKHDAAALPPPCGRRRRRPA